MHAHKCMKCASNGVNTVWIHGDECKGVIQAHTCPKCGSVEWKKWMVEIGKLPHQMPQHASGKSNEILAWVAIFAIVAIVAVASYFQLTKIRELKSKIPTGKS